MSELSENKPAAKTMMLEVVTPNYHFYEGKVEQVVLSALDGDLGILPGRAPVVVALAPGIAHITVNGEKRHALMTEGYAEIGPYMTIVVCNAAEWPEDIDVERAFRALERADKRYHDNATSKQEKIYARHAIRRAKMRLKLIREFGSEAQKKTLSGLKPAGN